MNSAEEKARELVDKFYKKQVEILNKNGTTELDSVECDIAKQCALIAVDEILKASTIKQSEHDKCKFVYIDEYWQQVKTEIEKL